MSLIPVITTYSLETNYLNLRTSLQQLSTATDVFSFYNTINQMIRNLNQMDQFIRSKRNKFGLHLPAVVIGHIFSFLPVYSVYSAQSTCKFWWEAFRLPLFQQILSKRQPIGGSYLRHWRTRGAPGAIALVGEKILIFEDMQTRGIWNLNGELIEKEIMNLAIYRVAASNEHICFNANNNEIQLMTLNNKCIRKVVISECRDLALSSKNQFIYVSSSSLISIFSFDGYLIRSWKLEDASSSYNSRKIAVYENKIFMTDYCGKLSSSSFHT